ncbi:hypothetical protein EUGRSUZ_C02805 [Eucalyptus grandis]|uniref:Uncharacterized protein n=2 Tax=Eucalyptus grandis TaxID=71139 RepID=A0ACC3LHB3_EUCGR|nr:hypothetical protein EUGRSUZ_C02805 [Eucalyptus grandis]
MSFEHNCKCPSVAIRKKSQVIKQSCTFFSIHSLHPYKKLGEDVHNLGRKYASNWTEPKSQARGQTRVEGT